MPISEWRASAQAPCLTCAASFQVCSILWSTNYKEFVSGHGFAQNQLVLWKYPTMTKVAELQGWWTGPGGTGLLKVEGSCTPWFEPAASLIQDSIQGHAARSKACPQAVEEIPLLLVYAWGLKSCCHSQ